MGVLSDEYPCRTELDALYEAFANARKPLLRPLGPQAYDADWIGRQPLRELPADLINDFAFELGDMIGDSEDVRYFLPRLCELLVRGELNALVDGPILLAQKLVGAEWRRWLQPEQRAIEAFLVAWFEASLSKRAPVFLHMMTAVAILFDDLSPWLIRIRVREDVAGVWALRWLAEGEGARLLRKNDRKRIDQEGQLLGWLREPASFAQVESLRKCVGLTSPEGEDLKWLYEETTYWLHVCGAKAD